MASSEPLGGDRAGPPPGPPNSARDRRKRLRRWAVWLGAFLVVLTVAAAIVGNTVSRSRNATPTERRAIEQLLRIATRAARAHNFRLSCELYDPAERAAVIYYAETAYHAPAAHTCVNAASVVAARARRVDTTGYSIGRISISGRVATVDVAATTRQGHIVHIVYDVTHEGDG